MRMVFHLRGSARAAIVRKLLHKGRGTIHDVAVLDLLLKSLPEDANVAFVDRDGHSQSLEYVKHCRESIGYDFCYERC